MINGNDFTNDKWEGDLGLSRTEDRLSTLSLPPQKKWFTNKFCTLEKLPFERVAVQHLIAQD